MTVYNTVMIGTVNHELYGSGAVVKRSKRQDAPQDLDRRRVGGRPDGHEGRWRRYWNWNGIDSKPPHVPASCLLTRRDMWVAMGLLTPGRLAAANLPRTIDNDRPSSHSEMNDNLLQRPQGQFRVRAKVTRGLPEPTGGSAVPGGLGHQQQSVRPSRGVAGRERQARWHCHHKPWDHWRGRQHRYG